MKTVIVLVFAVPIALILAAFLRAVTARMLTGKWPHQDATAKRIYDSLP